MPRPPLKLDPEDWGWYGYRPRRPFKRLFDVIWLAVLFVMLVMLVILALLLAQIRTAQ